MLSARGRAAVLTGKLILDEAADIIMLFTTSCSAVRVRRRVHYKAPKANEPIMATPRAAPYFQETGLATAPMAAAPLELAELAEEEDPEDFALAEVTVVELLEGAGDTAACGTRETLTICAIFESCCRKEHEPEIPGAVTCFYSCAPTGAA